MPAEIEVKIEDKPNSEKILAIFAKFIKEDGNYRLDGEIKYKLYENKKSFIKNLFNFYLVAGIFIYEDWMCVDVSEKDLDKINALFERFLDYQPFVKMCKDINYRISIKVEND